jgi:hypothetical protein
LKNERVTPVQPVVDVVKANVAKTEASAIIKDAKDWAVYEITTDATVKRVLAYADSDVFARTLADAEYARVYNQWVKDGKKDGAEPKPSTVIKVGEAGSKMQAQKALSLPNRRFAARSEQPAVTANRYGSHSRRFPNQFVVFAGA